MNNVKKRIELLENTPRANIPVGEIFLQNGKKEKLQGLPLERIFQVGEGNVRKVTSDDPDILGLVRALFKNIATELINYENRKKR